MPFSLSNIFSGYENIWETSLNDRFFVPETVYRLIGKIPKNVLVEILGHSTERRPIYQLTIGNGPTKILLWSQMHGNEPTATAALFDLLNFIQQKKHDAADILRECTLHIVPMLNPDGAWYHTRRNAQNIDINRDYLAGTSVEGRLLRNLHDKISPDFAFNLHNQESLWGVSKTKLPTCLAFLAPPFDDKRSMNWVREQSARVIACMVDDLQAFIPGRLAKWSDEFEPRAFGDNFQKAGTPTILIESGSYKNDPQKQHVRMTTFMALLSALQHIATKNYQQKELLAYQMLPENVKNLFHLLIRQAMIEQNGLRFQTDIGLNYSEIFDPEKRCVKRAWYLADMGDLSTYGAYEEICEAECVVTIGSPIEGPLELELKTGSATQLLFRNGSAVQTGHAD